MENDECSREVHDERDPQNDWDDESQYGRFFHVDEFSFSSLSHVDEERQDERDCKENIDEVENDLHFIEMKFSLRGHGESIKLKLSSIERVKIVYEDVIVRTDESS